ncbi:MAG: transcription elongation factor GreA [Limnochordia bacterium]|jgi:transcription elongation factor GreA
MAEKEVVLTPEGLAKLEKELEHLKTVRRREVAARIKQALEFGDISENSEYDDAKNEQAFVEGRVLQLEKLLRNARLIDDDEVDDGVVCLGTRFTLRDLESGEEYEYALVGSAEADPSAAKISNESPVGKAVLGKSVGSVVEVHAPGGLLRYQVVRIAR